MMLTDPKLWIDLFGVLTEMVFLAYFMRTLFGRMRSWYGGAAVYLILTRLSLGNFLWYYFGPSADDHLPDSAALSSHYLLPGANFGEIICWLIVHIYHQYDRKCCAQFFDALFWSSICYWQQQYAGLYIRGSHFSQLNADRDPDTDRMAKAFT